MALLIAPTGGGKTLAGFLPSLVELERQGGGHGMHTLYSPPLLESLAILIACPEAPKMFERLACVVVDELHALVGAKRGQLLALGCARPASGRDRVLRPRSMPMQCWRRCARPGRTTI